MALLSRKKSKTPRAERPGAKLGGGRPKTARDIMLDPHGVYGTRTASRVAASRRRRSVQRAVLLALLLVAGAVAASRRWTLRSRVVAPLSRFALPCPPAAAPVEVEDAGGRALLVPLQSGALWRVPLSATASRNAPRRVWATGFPACASPATDGATLFLPCADGFVRALNGRDGHALWGTRMPGTPVAQPLVVRGAGTAGAANGVGGLVIAGDDSGAVLALDARSGRVMWRRRVPGPVGSGMRAVAVGEGGAARQGVLVPLLDAPGRRGGLICLDASSGATLWRYGVAFATGAGQSAPPALVEGGAGAQLFCADEGGSVAALAPRDGRKLWKSFLRPLHGAARDESLLLHGAPVAWTGAEGAGRVAVGGEDGGLRALDARSGRVLWTWNAGAPLLLPAVPLLLPARNGEAARERLLVAPGSLDPDEGGARLWLLDAASGTPVAEFALDAPPAGAPIVDGAQFLVVTRAGSVLRFVLPGEAPSLAPA